MDAVKDRIRNKNNWLDEQMRELKIDDPVCRSLKAAGEHTKGLGEAILAKMEAGEPGWTEGDLEPIATRFEETANDLGEGAKAAASVH